MLPVPPSFRDGNDADSESAGKSSLGAGRRPPSALAGGRRSRAGRGEDGDAGAGVERPKWR